MKCELIHRISRTVNSTHLNGAQPPERSPESVGRADADGVSFTAALGKVWGPLHGVPQGPNGTRQSLGSSPLHSPGLYLTQHQGTWAWDPLAG